MAKETTYEWCAHCEYEVEIPAKEVSYCPQCGASIRPCGDCPNNGTSLHDQCGWKENGYCIAFPTHRDEANPCEREKDADEWVCINDHTGCLWNDGHNGCSHEGEKLFPIKSKFEKKTV